jgi:glycosyltransferase involved in cell wall biosynthesis
LSVIVPLYNEEESIRPLYAAIVQALGDIGCTFEMVFVDDGSKDNTAEIAREIARIDSRLRLVKFRRNYGQTAAMAAGIEHASGEILVTMDADLQNDPADIPRLLAKLREGYDLVVGWRHERQDKWLSRRLPSVIANRLIAAITGVDVKDNGCTLKAFRAELIRKVPLYGEMHRFIPAIASTVGCDLAEVKVRHHPRRHGHSKYGLSRIYRVLLDIIAIKTLITFARRPLFCFFSVAAAAFVLSVISASLAIVFVEQSVVVFASVAVLAGSLALFLGFAGVISSLVSQYGGDRLAPLQPTLDDLVGGAR